MLVGPLVASAEPSWNGPSSTSACRRSARASCARTSSTDGAVLPARTSGSASRASSSSSPSTSRRRRSSPSTRTSRRTRTRGSQHARGYAEGIVERLGLGGESFVVEVASNDGYLLQHFVATRHPGPRHRARRERRRRRRSSAACRPRSRSSARRRRDELVARGPERRPDHRQQRPRPGSGPERLRGRDRDRCSRRAARSRSSFPHLMRLIEANQFDTIYHEHFSYFSLLTAERVFAAHGLAVFDVDELPTHGGSLRLYARHAERGTRALGARCEAFRRREEEAGLRLARAAYAAFARAGRGDQAAAARLPRSRQSAEGKSIAGYGAPGKGNTLLNYCGIRTDFARLHGRPQPVQARTVHSRARTSRSFRRSGSPETKPDYVWILPWNLKDEIVEQLAYMREWGGRLRRRRCPS